MIPEIFLLVKQICPRRAQIDNLRTSVAILLKSSALKAVECVADSFSATNYALVLIVAKGALIADSNKSGRPYVGVADRAFAVALIAEPAE